MDVVDENLPLVCIDILEKPKRINLRDIINLIKRDDQAKIDLANMQ